MTNKYNPRVTLDELEYIVLEGGGGKGATYLGVLNYLQEVGVLPIRANGREVVNTLNPNGPYSYIDESKKPKIKGIAGASAGAITAFTMALGLTADEIKAITEQELVVDGKAQRRKSTQKKPDNVFDQFLDYPQNYLTTEGSSVANSNDDYVFPVRQLFFIPNSNRYSQKVDPRKIDRDNLFLFPVLNGFMAALLAKKEYNEFHKDPAASKIFVYDGNKPQIPTVGQIDNLNYAAFFVQGLLTQGGMMGGLGIRAFFEDLVQKHFIKPRKNTGLIDEDFKPHDLTFEVFYKHTGIDFRLTSTNITKGNSYIFSKESTPKFPVIEAVQMSMNIPILYRPIEITGGSPLDGQWVDGGMLNNYPIHAFDSKDGKTPKGLVGFRIQDGFGPKYKHLETIEKKEDDDSTYKIFKLFGDLINTFAWPSEWGQIRNDGDKIRTITLLSHNLSMTNFSPSEEDKAPAVAYAYEKTKKYFKADESESLKGAIPQIPSGTLGPNILDNQ